MEKEELKTYIQFLLHNYRVMDAFWFIKISEHFDLRTAENLNAEVWDRVAGLAGKDLMTKFDFRGKGLKGFVQALKLFPWCILVGYDIDAGDDEVIITVPDCPAQTARLKRGLGEYDCKQMHMNEFTSFARQVDPRIEIACLFAPPDHHPDDMFCKWRFTLSGQG